MKKHVVHAPKVTSADGGSISKIHIYSCLQELFSFSILFSCIEANLNGVYRFNPLNNNYVGIIWEKWLGDYSLKTTKMMIRPKVNWSRKSQAADYDDESSKKPPNDP